MSHIMKKSLELFIFNRKHKNSTHCHTADGNQKSGELTSWGNGSLSQYLRQF